MRLLPYLPILLCLACQSKPAPAPAPAPSPTLNFFVGTYTQHEGHVDGHSEGIYKLSFDPNTLELQVTDTIKGMTNPSFLALSKDNATLYAVNEISPGTAAIGLFEAYKVTKESFGQKLNASSTQGYAPCHIALNKQEDMAVVSNYVGGVVSVFRINGGEIQVPQILQFNKQPKASPRQEDSHPHSALFSADGHMVYVADLGTDRIMMFQVDKAAGQLRPADPAYFELEAGAGPRHMCLSADGKILYVLNELSNSITVCAIADNGSLSQKQSIKTLPEDFTNAKNYPADIHLSQNGKHLYSSNRGHNSIAVFAIDENGNLSTQGHVSTEGKFPRNFCLTKDGNWMLVANQNSDDICLFDLKKEALPVFIKKINLSTPVAILETN